MKTDRKPHLLDLTLPEWKQAFEEAGQKSFRGVQVFGWLHKQRIYDPRKMGNISKHAVEFLEKNFHNDMLKSVDRTQSGDESWKVLWQDEKGRRFESVWLENKGRATVCISTQAGCSLNCEFCASGQVEFQGNLSSGQMLEQVYLMEKMASQKATNVVFMGMGEPFHNYDDTLRAAYNLHDSHGGNIGARRITISTAGVLPAMKKYYENDEPFNLALSVHTLDPEKRAQIMDVEKRWPIADVITYLKKQHSRLQKHFITLEYVMIPGLNMSRQDALLLGKTTRSLSGKVNLIPLNIEFQGYRRPRQDEMLAFQEAVISTGVQAYNRASQGSEISAACGMLRAKTQEGALTG